MTTAKLRTLTDSELADLSAAEFDAGNEWNPAADHTHRAIEAEWDRRARADAAPILIARLLRRAAAGRPVRLTLDAAGLLLDREMTILSGMSEGAIIRTVRESSELTMVRRNAIGLK